MLRKLYGIVSSGSVIGSFIAIVPITLAVGLIYAVYCIVKSRKSDTPVSLGTGIMKFLFVLYLTGLVNLTLVPPNLWTSVWARIVVGYSSERPAFFSGDFNFVPTFFGLISGTLTAGGWIYTMLLFNFLMFVPFGFFLPFVSNKVNGKNIFLIAVAVPAVIEIIQPVIGRSFDTDDLILNFAGIIAGFFAAKAIRFLAGKIRTLSVK